MYNLLLVALGGACGSSARYLLSDLITNLFRGQAFPFATISVNILGSLAAGILHFLAVNHMDIFTPETRLLLMVGFLGGFTTFSAFSVDVLRLVSAGQIATAATYAILSVTFSILAVFFGFYLAKLVF
jgi:CrcB protein